MAELKVGQLMYGIGFGNEHVRSKSIADQPVHVVEVVSLGRKWAKCVAISDDGFRSNTPREMDIQTLRMPSFNGHHQMFSSREELQEFKTDLIRRKRCQSAFGMTGIQGVDRLSTEEVKKLYQCLKDVGLLQPEEI